jgi:hypothetical protein
MGKCNWVHNRPKRVSFFSVVFSLMVPLLYGCAGQRPQLSASQYRFTFNDATYRIRSITSGDRTESYNELIGQEFMAADFDRDRVIDCILLGEVSLSRAQEVYEYGLNGYVYESNEFHFEIKSFRPASTPPFNEFKITSKRQLVSPQVIVAVDQNADGMLDEVSKGSVALEEVQPKYAEAIESGLQRLELVRVDHAVLVREK